MPILDSDLYLRRRDFTVLCACWAGMKAEQQQAVLLLITKVGGNSTNFRVFLDELCTCCGTPGSTPGPNPNPNPNPDPKPNPNPNPDPNPKPKPEPKPETVDCIKGMLEVLCKLGPDRIEMLATLISTISNVMDPGTVKNALLCASAALRFLANTCRTNGKVTMSDVKGLCFVANQLQTLQGQGVLANLATYADVLDAFIKNMAQCCSDPAMAGVDFPPWLTPVMKNFIAVR